MIYRNRPTRTHCKAHMSYIDPFRFGPFWWCRIASNSLRVEFSLKSDSGYPRDAGVILFKMATPGSPLRFNTHWSAPPVSALARSGRPGARQVSQQARVHTDYFTRHNVFSIFPDWGYSTGSERIRVVRINQVARKSRPLGTPVMVLESHVYTQKQQKATWQNTQFKTRNTYGQNPRDITKIPEASQGGVIALTTTKFTRQHDIVSFSQATASRQMLWSDGPWTGRKIEPAWENYYASQGYKPTATCKECGFKKLCVLTSLTPTIRKLRLHICVV